MSDLNALLNDTTPEQLAGDPFVRRAFIVAMLASDFYLPVQDGAAKKTKGRRVSLRAVMVDDVRHALLFSSEAKMKKFMPPGTQFAKVTGADFFPSLRGQFAILNPGPSGLQLRPDDIDEMLG